jgi:hypothetical protein
MTAAGAQSRDRWERIQRRRDLQGAVQREGGCWSISGAPGRSPTTAAAGSWTSSDHNRPPLGCRPPRTHAALRREQRPFSPSAPPAGRLDTRRPPPRVRSWPTTVTSTSPTFGGASTSSPVASTLGAVVAP